MLLIIVRVMTEPFGTSADDTIVIILATTFGVQVRTVTTEAVAASQTNKGKL